MKVFKAALAVALLLSAAEILTTAAAPRVPTHIPTWAYDEYRAQGATASSEQVRRYVTYAEGGLGNGKAAGDCAPSPKRCWSVWYFDPHLVYDSPSCPYAADAQFLAAASENWYVHWPGFEDAGHRVHGEYTRTCKGEQIRIPVYVINIGNAAVRAFFRNYLRENAGAWDYYLMDDAKATLVDQMYGPGGGFCRGMNLRGWCTSTQEFPNNAALMAAQAGFADSMNRADGTPMKFFVNGDPNLLRGTSRYIGFECENCVVDAGTFRTNNYEHVLTSMAKVESMGDTFVLLSTGNAPAGSAAQIDQRIVTTAVVWLGFRDSRTVVWPDLEYDRDNLAVWPEDEIYPTQPLESMSDSASDLEVAPAVWRREFAACYEDGRPIGPCAAILNGNGTAATVRANWLKRNYHHVIELSGGDCLSGGAVLLRSQEFSAGATPIPAGRAVLLAL
jgi:hypothetical protein